MTRATNPGPGAGREWAKVCPLIHRMGTAKFYVEDTPQQAGELHTEIQRRWRAFPDLLAALEKAADYMGEMGYPEDILTEARAAIRKAKGDA